MALTECQLQDVRKIIVPAITLTDEEIVADILSGNVNAYGSILRRYNQRLYRVARSIVRNDAAAMDVVQEAHIKAYSKIADFKGSSSFLTWLYAITRNEALMHLRKYKMERNMNVIDIHSLNSEKENEKPDLYVNHTDNLPEKILENSELKQLINNNVDNLPADFRIVFVLRAIEHLSVRETAEILDIKEETVKTRYFRAKRLMHKKIRTYLDLAGMQIYEFGGEHCDVVVHNVLAIINLKR